jgi:hypothetical protein
LLRRLHTLIFDQLAPGLKPGRRPKMPSLAGVP